MSSLLLNDRKKSISQEGSSRLTLVLLHSAVKVSDTILTFSRRKSGPLLQSSFWVDQRTVCFSVERHPTFCRCRRVWSSPRRISLVTNGLERRGLTYSLHWLMDSCFVDCSVRTQGRGGFLWCDIERSNWIGEKKQVWNGLISERPIKWKGYEYYNS